MEDRFTAQFRGVKPNVMKIIKSSVATLSLREDFIIFMTG